MSKISKDKRAKIILIGVGTLVIAATLWFLLLAAQQETLKKVQAEAAKSQEQLASGQRTVKSQELEQQEFVAAESALRQRESTLASSSDLYLWHIEMLNKFRQGYQVEIPQFGREIMSDVGALPKFPYSAAAFSVRGSAHFHEFGKFLADFENAFPYIRVQNITLEPGPGETASGADREKLSFKMEMLCLIRPNAL